MSKVNIDSLNETGIIDEVIYLAFNREIVESRGSRKPLVESKVKLEALKALAAYKNVNLGKSESSSKGRGELLKAVQGRLDEADSKAGRKIG